MSDDRALKLHQAAEKTRMAANASLVAARNVLTAGGEDEDGQLDIRHYARIGAELTEISERAQGVLHQLRQWQGAGSGERPERGTET